MKLLAHHFNLEAFNNKNHTTYEIGTSSAIGSVGQDAKGWDISFADTVNTFFKHLKIQCKKTVSKGTDAIGIRVDYFDKIVVEHEDDRKILLYEVRKKPGNSRELLHNRYAIVELDYLIQLLKSDYELRTNSSNESESIEDAGKRD